MMRRILGTVLLVVWFIVPISAQISIFPYTENFDSSDSLPAGWSTTGNKVPSGDFSVIASSVHSAPHCVVSVNGTIAQSLISPSFDLTGAVADSLRFYERRTSTHRSGLIVDAVIDGDTSSPILLSDTLRQEASSLYVRRSLPLSNQLNNRPDVRFRWRVLADTLSGATGAIRFDDIEVTVKKTADLAATSAVIFPQAPKRGEQVFVRALIVNKGLSGLFSFTVSLYDSSSLIDRRGIERDIAQNDSIGFDLLYPDIPAGLHALTLKVDLPGDEDTTNDSFSFPLSVRYRERDLLINEIMYAPKEGPEWIECVNISGDTLNLRHWQVADRSSKRTVTTGDVILQSGMFVILTRDSSVVDLFPNITVPTIVIPSLPTLNNDSDAVVLIDATGAAIDSVMYHASWGGRNGNSLERIDTARPTDDAENWSGSTDPAGATPGAVNSVTQKDFDVAVASLHISPNLPAEGDIMTAAVVAQNKGREAASAVSVDLYIDADGDSAGSDAERIALVPLSSLASGESVAVVRQLPPLSPGRWSLIAAVSAARDDDASNNSDVSVIDIGVRPKSIVINEIMYAPPGDMPEWIELYNRSGYDIDISQWSVSDAGKNKGRITGTGSVVPAGGYVIVTTDVDLLRSYLTDEAAIVSAPFSALNNTTADAVVVYDDRGMAIDSVWYLPPWGGTNGSSLQRFDTEGASGDSSNWISALPTPGVENVIAKKYFDVEISSFSAERAGKGFLLSTTVRNIGREPALAPTLRVYHDANFNGLPEPEETIESTALPSLAPDESRSVSLDWHAAIAGRHVVIAVVEAAGDQRAINNIRSTFAEASYSSGALIINEIMYEPKSGEAEFVELFNPTADSVDIGDWKMMDTPSPSGSRSVITLSSERKYLHGGEYFIVASDSSIFHVVPDTKKAHVCIAPSLGLNNSGEDIILTDLTGTAIDSVRYEPSWHLKNVETVGRSLERIAPSVSGNDARNWSTSVAPAGATPLERNSVYLSAGSSVRSLSLSPNPFSPDGDGFEDFLSISYALPSSSSRIRIRIFDVRGRLVRRLADNELSPASGAVIWNGQDDNGRKVHIGMYIILFEAFDNFGGPVSTMKDVAVVAGRL